MLGGQFFWAARYLVHRALYSTAQVYFLSKVPDSVQGLPAFP